MMKLSATLSLLLSLFLLLHTANAFNITRVLDQYSDFSNFNSYLSETHLADEINSRQTITILAVENSNLNSLSGKPLSVIKNIMSIHVVLDYYDMPKLTKLSNNSAILTTLYQTTGQARNHQGFVNVTKLTTGGIAFGSAAPGSSLGSNLVKMVTSQPYDLSVMQVSNVIVPEGIDSVTSPPSKGSPPPPPPSPPAPAPTESPPSPAPKESPPAPAPKSKAPTPSRKVGPAPKEAEAPAPIPDGPIADAPAADKKPPADKKSAGTTLDTGVAVMLTMVLSTLYLASTI